MAGEDQTEAATPRRLQRARDEGSVALSREVPALAGLGAGTLMLAMMGPMLGKEAMTRLSAMMSPSAGTDITAALAAVCVASAALAGPLILGVLAASVAASFLQTGFLFNPGALRPDLARLNPAHGFKRIFGISGLVETGKAIIKLSVLGYATFHVLSGGLPALRGGVFWFPEQLASRTTQLVLQLAMTLLGSSRHRWRRYGLGPHPPRKTIADEQRGDSARVEGHGRQSADQAAPEANSDDART